MESGGYIGCSSYKTTLADPKELPVGTCLLCGGYSFHNDGITTMHYQDGSGSVEYIQCWRCGGTGKEPPASDYTDLLIGLLLILAVLLGFVIGGSLR